MRLQRTAVLLTTTALLLGATATVRAQAAAAPAEESVKGVIAGTMDITFNTRTNLDTSGDLKANSPAMGVSDQYRVSLTVNKTRQIAGTVDRRPNLYSSVLGRRKQDAQLQYDLSLVAVKSDDPTQKRTVGKWVGLVPIDTASGAYLLAGGKAADRPLRIAIDTVGTAPGFESFFDGRLVGKAEKKESLAAYTYKRLVGGKEVSMTVQRVDPMKFENITLAMGPDRSSPAATVNGRLDYDYETGNYLTDGIRFTYTVDGKEITDTVTGTIKWVEDPNRAANGKGQYEFNLRFNEERHKKAPGEDAAFAPAGSDEDAFFAVDNTVPSLTGTIAYVDSMSGGDTVTASKVTYALDSNKLTRQQVMNFAKLWLLAVGPTNDE